MAFGDPVAASNTEMPQLKLAQPIERSNPETVSRQGMRSWVEDSVSTELSSKRKHEIRSAFERSARFDADGQVARYPDRDTAIARLSAETKLPHTPAVDGEFVAGIYRQDVTLNSGRFAVIDNGLGFAFVPWAPELDRHRGRHITGVAKESGEIEWSFGRKRGLEI